MMNEMQIYANRRKKAGNDYPNVSPCLPKIAEMGKQVGKQISEKPINRWVNNENMNQK